VFISAWILLDEDRGDDDDQGGGMMQPVFQGLGK
tara:strand:- start:506 stop:607 length:102 start_codon:yes stop_codon:yes gene_type:complete